MEKTGQTVVLWVRARVMASDCRTRQKDGLVRGRVRCPERTKLKDKLCLPDISRLNAGVQPQHTITRGAHDDIVSSIAP